VKPLTGCSSRSSRPHRRKAVVARLTELLSPDAAPEQRMPR
jgi:hypothetical protein